MRVGSLFSGYGGLDLAVGGNLVWYSEMDKAASQVMQAHYPDVPNLGDITKIDWSEVEPVDVITGGYPCQPFSNAGKRKGTKDERHLWPYVREAIRTIRPKAAVLENVRGHLSLGFDIVLADLAQDGMSAQWCVIRAADAGAPHNRARLFIVVSDAEGEGLQGHQPAAAHHEGGLARRRSTAEGDRIASNSDGSGSEARIDSGSNVDPIRQQPLGRSAFVTDSDCERYGSRQGSSQVEGMDGEDEAGSREREWTRQESGAGSAVDWREYEPAIRRWELITDRSAPLATITVNEKSRLNPEFVEWMMGLPEGWVTGHGLSNAQALKMLGNGVVPQQAALALKILDFS